MKYTITFEFDNGNYWAKCETLNGSMLALGDSYEEAKNLLIEKLKKRKIEKTPAPITIEI